MRLTSACFFPLLVLSIGCGNLPTAPAEGHAALTANEVAASTGRRRVASPYNRLAPPCAAPAPLQAAAPQERVPGYIFRYRDGTASKSVTAELASRYGFSPEFVYTVFPGFAAVVSEQALAAMRCDNRIESVEYDVSAHLAGG
jgi:hypothetical protein